MDFGWEYEGKRSEKAYVGRPPPHRMGISVSEETLCIYKLHTGFLPRNSGIWSK